MSDALHRLLDALPARDTPLPLFLRDDDAGWADERLLQLIDTTAAAGVPLDLAAIPAAVTPGLAATLCRHLDAEPALLGLHQHGCHHLSHEPEAPGARKCEFGPARAPDAQRADLLHGRSLLLQHFGARVDPLFTPPWNRCAAFTPALLAELGFVALSRDRGAPAQADLPELPVDVDWSCHHRAGGAAAVADALAAALQARAADGQPLGLMLHHAVMDEAEFALLGRLLRRLAAHPGLRWQPMRALRASAGRPQALA
jgi:hypothetical protein